MGDELRLSAIKSAAIDQEIVRLLGARGLAVWRLSRLKVAWRTSLRQEVSRSLSRQDAAGRFITVQTLA